MMLADKGVVGAFDLGLVRGRGQAEFRVGAVLLYRRGGAVRQPCSRTGGHVVKIIFREAEQSGDSSQKLRFVTRKIGAVGGGDGKQTGKNALKNGGIMPEDLRQPQGLRLEPLRALPRLIEQLAENLCLRVGDLERPPEGQNFLARHAPVHFGQFRAQHDDAQRVGRLLQPFGKAREIKPVGFWGVFKDVFFPFVVQMAQNKPKRATQRPRGHKAQPAADDFSCNTPHEGEGVRKGEGDEEPS